MPPNQSNRRARDTKTMMPLHHMKESYEDKYEKTNELTRYYFDNFVFDGKAYSSQSLEWFKSLERKSRRNFSYNLSRVIGYTAFTFFRNFQEKENCRSYQMKMKMFPNKQKKKN